MSLLAGDRVRVLGFSSLGGMVMRVAIEAFSDATGDRAIPYFDAVLDPAITSGRNR